ncbi:class I SAM-dependent methyltransferase [Kordiimonas aquimaris]|uniref:class I SAM-dependent methyltransferase n=1 Tax=Kordiimonas aquimaris TaxID=707591 RepID=UPI0021CF9FCC|nr:SAM-dependent methyltransferase [Kordiimonas aquimaris]
MNALYEHLLKRINTDGPISLSDYMATCLMHPQHGYYQTERVFGREGDFITAPEVSQMFGEMIGLWLADRWINMGRPTSVNLIELGPGRGTLMADILRATAAVHDFQDAIDVHFVEASTQLRAKQAEAVPCASWHDRFSDIPTGPVLIVANEFFDALPIHQYEKLDGQWHERVVCAVKGRLGFGLAPCGPQFAMVNDEIKAGSDGSIAEVCPAALSIAGDISDYLKHHGGAALIIDYGYRKSAAGDTFQAMKSHSYVDPFLEPGMADLTAHVAFDQLKSAAKEIGAKVYGPATQGMFLMAIGLGARAQVLSQDDTPGSQERILSELKRLTSNDQMGTLFKVLAIQNADLPAPPGL